MDIRWIPLILAGPVLPSFFVYYLNTRNKRNGVYLENLPKLYYGGTVLLLIASFFIVDDDQYIGPVILANTLFFGCYFLYYFSNRKDPLKDERPNSVTIHSVVADEAKKNEVVIPGECPHCRNPNTNALRTCEWCGNKIV